MLADPVHLPDELEQRRSSGSVLCVRHIYGGLDRQGACLKEEETAV